MDWLLIILVLLVLFGIGVIRGCLRDSTAKDARKRLGDFLTNALEVKVITESVPIDVEDGPESIEVYSISISGSLVVPHDKTKCRMIVTAFDSTNSVDDLSQHPVMCLIDELSDASGFFNCSQDITVPYKMSSVDNMEVLRVPVSSLVFPKRGKRNARFVVELVPESLQALAELVPQELRAFTQTAETSVVHNQEAYGFLEMKKRDADAEKAIFVLALCISAADGRIVGEEKDMIQGFFARRFAALEPEDVREREAAINKVAARFRQVLHTKGDLHKVWHHACNRIEMIRDDQISYAAYELCVKLVAADKSADNRELELLSKTAERLGIPDQLARELRDRIIALEYYGDHNKITALEMPESLTEDEQRDYLTREYHKWHRLETSSDSKIAKDARERAKIFFDARRDMDARGQ